MGNPETGVSHFFNPNHDARGRFAAHGGSGKHSPGNAPKFSPPYGKADKLKAVQKLLMTASKLRSGLTPEEKIALEDYTKTFQGSHAINHALNGQAKKMWDSGKLYTTEHQAQTTEKSIHALERIVDKTPLNSTPIELMRGLGNVGKSWGKPGSLEGKTLSAEQFSSTTMEVTYAQYAAGTTARMLGNKPGQATLMIIHAPEGTVRAVPVSDILHGDRKGARPQPGHEVLLPPGTKVKVHNDTAVTEPIIPGQPQVFNRIVRVEVLPEDPNYRQSISYRDNLSADVSELANPHHDKRGRFTTAGNGTRSKAGPPKNAAESEVDKILAEVRARKAGQKHLDPIHEHYTKRENLTDQTVTAVKFYEGDFQRCGAMNDILRYGDIQPANDDATMYAPEAKIREHVDSLKAEFSRAPKLSQDTTVYRAMRSVPPTWVKGPSQADLNRAEILREKRKAAQKRGDWTENAALGQEIRTLEAGSSAGLVGRVIKDEGFSSTTAEVTRAKQYLAFSRDEQPAMLELKAPAGTPTIAVNSILGKDGGAVAELLLAPGTAYRVTGESIENGYRIIKGEILPQVSELANPYHDENGRFATAPHSAVTKPDGGFTFDPTKGRMATKGFAISPFPERSKVLDVDNLKPKQIRDAITDYAVENMDLAEKDNHFIGGWRDPQPGGKVYLDVSIVVKDAEEARRLALKHDQIAYFDFSTGQSVQVNANAKSGQK